MHKCVLGEEGGGAISGGEIVIGVVIVVVVLALLVTEFVRGEVVIVEGALCW